MKAVTSILSAQYNDLMAIKDGFVLENKVVEIANKANIDPINRRRIVNTVSSFQGDLLKVQTYVTNSMLKFNGHGVLRKNYR